MAETKALTLKQAIEEPEIVAKFTRTLGNNQNKAQAFLRSVLIATQNNPMLKATDPMSVLASAMVAASLDLEINPNLGYSALIPYGNKCQFQLMVNGLTQLFFRSGQAKALNTFVVYSDEYNGYNKITGTLNPLKEHDEMCTDVVGYGCYLELTNGFSKTEYWSKSKVKDHALKYSQAYKKGLECPWKSAFDQMALKTVLKYVLNHYAPKTTDMQMALNADQSIVSVNEDNSFNFNYADNAMEIQYSEEEMATRSDLLYILNEHGFDEKSLLIYFKADSIDQIPTAKLEERVTSVTNVSSSSN